MNDLPKTTRSDLSGGEKPLRSSLLIASLMLVGRLLGFLRDLNTAAVLGMSGSPAADAFFCAFRLPNLFRRLNEEGAFGLSWIPIFTETWRRDRTRAWGLLTVLLRRTAVWAFGLTALGELFALAVLGMIGPAESADALFFYRAVQLTMILLPSLLFLMLAAEAGATLQALGRFGIAAFMPIVFNLFWLAALFLISPFGVWLPFAVRSPFKTLFGQSVGLMTPFGRTAILAAAIVAATGAQFLIQRVWLRILLREKSLPRLDKKERAEDRASVGRALRQVMPTALGLLFVQINTLLATFAATLFAGEFGSRLGYRAASGAASAIYFAERLYEFPLGLIGVAVGLSFYPLLSRLAAERNAGGLVCKLSLAVRTVLLLAIPAAFGLALIAEPLATLLYQRGDFSPTDAHRTASLIRIFAFGVPAFCLQPILIRTFYALSERAVPIRAGLISTAVFIVLTGISFVLLAWRGAGSFGLEKGLAAAIALSAYTQTFLLAAALNRRERLVLDFSRWLRTVFRAFLAASGMSAAVIVLILAFDVQTPIIFIGTALGTAIPLYAFFIWLLGERDILFCLFCAEAQKKSF